MVKNLPKNPQKSPKKQGEKKFAKMVKRPSCRAPTKDNIKTVNA
jgi:hypothetical protein